MQGRLLPKYQGRFQAHPVGYWQEEFPEAAELGLDCIEFILDFNNAEQNPLLTEEGRQEIQVVSIQTGVKVLSVCADYFMEAPLHSENEKTTNESVEILYRLCEAAKELEIRNIVIPCVDKSSIQDEKLCQRFQEIISEVVSVAEKCRVNLSLETDLNPIQFDDLLKQLGYECVTVNYDIGNSASLGYDPEEELRVYGDRISDIHIKDRALHGGSVKLGTGNADIPGFFKLLESYNYQGHFIMQAYRDDEGVTIFRDQLNWVKTILGITT